MSWAVGFNLLFAVPGQVGGSEQYLCRQITSVLDAGTVSPTIFALRDFPAAHPELVARCALRVAPTSGRRRALRVALESTWLSRQVRASGVQLLHHGGGTVPMRHGRVPSVVTVHDVQYLTYPRTFSSLKLRYLRSAMPASMRRAAVVTVPSEFVRSTVLDAFGLDTDRVVVVPHPIPPAELTVRTEANELRARYDLGRHVLVLPAITYAHKNHAVVLDALGLVGRSDVTLVLLGGRGPAESEVMGHVHARGLEAVVRRPGRVSDADRNGLLAMADALVFPSRYEGFGAPVIEAMWAGCPVLAADATALTEVVADGGLLLDPDDAVAWAAAIATVIEDPVRRQTLIDAGAVRAQQFGPAQAAAALATAYGRALS